MTKSDAIKLLQELISYKENSLEILNGNKFTTDLEEISKEWQELLNMKKKFLSLFYLNYYQKRNQ